MVRFGCFMIVLAIAALMVIIVLPVIPPLGDNTTIDQFLQPLICQPGETIQRDLYSQSTYDGTSFSMDVYCVDQEGAQRDETGRWTLVGAAGFVLPFLIGLFAVISGSNRNAAKQVAQMTASLNAAGVAPTRQPWATSSEPPHPATLTQRLKELQDAHEAGLLTALEYERTRQKILDSLDD